MQPDCSTDLFTGKSEAQEGIHRTFHMESMSTSLLEDTDFQREEEEEEDCNKGEDESDSPTEEAPVAKQQKPAWAPCFYLYAGKEVFHYVGHKIVIEEGLDSFAGMIWPAALALSHLLDTQREQFNLVDKTVLEIGAGTGLVSIVATLLGGWVTATDVPEALSKLRANLFRNTRRYCRHMPQVAALSWSHDLESTYPSSIYRYDYVLATDVVYHHDYLDELLATMKHFCRPGTTLMWANKVRLESDLTFMDNFKKAFKTSLLVDDGEVKIFMATSREGEEDDGIEQGMHDPVTVEEEGKGDDEDEQSKDQLVKQEHCEIEEKELEKEENHLDYEEEEVSDDGDVNDDLEDSASSDEDDRDMAGEKSIEEKAVEQVSVPTNLRSLNQDVYHYVGQDIVIRESIDSYGAVMWPAALALCSFLENNRDTMNLQGKTVLELGAGTGLVTIVASLLGAAVTATDLPDVLGNLRGNVMRNTRGHCRYTPQVEVLSWGYNLEDTHPPSVHRYDYVLAADVVYHHDYLDELLATMKHFCRPGTTLIWANKVRFENDLTFTDNFKKTFNTGLLFEHGEMKIFRATSRESHDEMRHVRN